jgi:hypothetical protein
MRNITLFGQGAMFRWSVASALTVPRQPDYRQHHASHSFGLLRSWSQEAVRQALEQDDDERQIDEPIVVAVCADEPRRRLNSSGSRSS